MLNGSYCADKYKKPDEIGSGKSKNNSQNNMAEAHLHASIKRTLKIVLSMLKRSSMLGDPLNFKTVKDRIIFGLIQEAYRP